MSGLTTSLKAAIKSRNWKGRDRNKLNRNRTRKNKKERWMAIPVRVNQMKVLQQR